MSKWVKLKVNGHIFETTLTTLLSCPDSMLAKMFASDSGFEPAYSEDGVYLLDADHKCFGVILNWLRYRKVMPDLDTNLKNVSEVASYFGLEELVDELKIMGAVVVMSDYGHASEDETGACMGLYFKETDNIYRQAGGDMYMWQDSQYIWYISDSLYEHKDFKLKNSTSKEFNLLPRKGWRCLRETSGQLEIDENLIVKDVSQVKFCNKITISCPKLPKKKFLGEFSRVPKVWQSGWPVFKNQHGLKLEVPKGENKWQSKGLLSSRSSSCPAHVMCGESKEFSEKYWQYDKKFGNYEEEKTIKLKCDVH